MKEKNHKGLTWFGIPKLIPYLRGYGRLFLSMVLFGLLASGMDVVIPLFQQYAINHFIADSTMQGHLALCSAVSAGHGCADGIQLHFGLRRV